MNRSIKITTMFRVLFLVTSLSLLVFVNSTIATVGIQKVQTAKQVNTAIKEASLSPTIEQRKADIDTFGNLPLTFIENIGQLDSQVVFYVDQPEYGLFFTNQAIHLRLTQKEKEKSKAHGLRIELVNADPKGRVKSVERASGIVSIFKGKKEQWKTNIPMSKEIAYTQPWTGISLHYKGDQGRIESVYHVSPGADPSLIRMRYLGQDSLSLGEKGNLIIKTSVGEVIESVPILYQEIHGKRIPVEGSFHFNGNIVSFNVGTYNKEYPLIIDPTIEYAGYIGGTGVEMVFDIAVDSSGNAYITGYADSNEATFPVTVGPDLTHNGGRDAFVAKVNAAGTALLYAGYIGGNAFEQGVGIAVDSSGNAYITGITESDEATFPVTVGPDLTFNGDLYDAFVAKIDPTGTALLYAGYIGGNANDTGQDIAVDGSGNAYVTGIAISGETTFPVTVGPDLTHNGGQDAFVAKVNPAGTALLYAGYIGGDTSDVGVGISVDGSGNAYITGMTQSNETTFPVTVGPDLTFNGVMDVFVAKVNPTGTALLYAGYIGGTEPDWIYGIAVDGSGNAYITGMTRSNETTFPVTVGPDLTYNGGDDAFVAKINPTGTALIYAGYIGGSEADAGQGIAVDGSGNAYISGHTRSNETTFPVTVGPDLTYNGGRDAFVAKVNAAGTALIYAGYIGGSSEENGYGIAVDSSGNAYITGFTNSNEATFPVTVGPDLTYNGGQDAFVAKIRADPVPSDTTAPTTTASPAGGTYASAQNVTLSCNDNGGSGCDKIYYTTDGSNPTTSSSYCSSPCLVDISTTTTLKFFGVDLAGNQEVIRTEVYIIATIVGIDIKPGEYPNNINLKSKGKVPVAILTTENFDANTINTETVLFADAMPVSWKMKDVDRDGDKDLLLYFNIQDLNITEQSTEATLTGKAYGGIDIQGTDSLNIVPKGKK